MSKLITCPKCEIPYLPGEVLFCPNCGTELPIINAKPKIRSAPKKQINTFDARVSDFLHSRTLKIILLVILGLICVIASCALLSITGILSVFINTYSQYL
jgi:hypothetical protein